MFISNISYLCKFWNYIYCVNLKVRKAMNKSFMESGGTVLSTNWAEIGKEKVSLKFGDGYGPNLCRVKKSKC